MNNECFGIKLLPDLINTRRVIECQPINYKLTLFVKGRLLGKYAGIEE